MFKRRDIIRRDYLNRVIKNMRDFLLSDKSREFLIFLVFFLIAGGFWLLQTLNSDYETELSVPVRLKGVPNEVVITSDLPSELRVKVRDRGTVLLNYALGKKFYPIFLNFKDYRGSDSHVYISVTQLERSIRGQLNASTRLVSVKPDTLEYIYSEGVSKRVPVKLYGKVSSDQLHYLSDTIFRPDSVSVFAPSGILDTITAAYTQSFIKENISETYLQHVNLVEQKGVKFVPSSIDVEFPVDIYTEKTVEVPLYGVGFPKGKILRTFPSKVKVTFQVGLSRFREINAEDFRIDIPYEDLLRLGTDKYTVKLSKVPHGISQVRCNPAQVDFLIEQISAEMD